MESFATRCRPNALRSSECTCHKYLHRSRARTSQPAQGFTSHREHARSRYCPQPDSGSMRVRGTAHKRSLRTKQQQSSTTKPDAITFLIFNFLSLLVILQRGARWGRRAWCGCVPTCVHGDGGTQKRERTKMLPYVS